MVNPVSIPEAAKSLRVSPGRVRAMAAHGQLPASKIGGRWLIERAAVDARLRQNSPGGRPLESHNAWALMLMASRQEIGEIDPSVKSRLRRTLEIEGMEKLGSRLSKRAEVRMFSAHPGEVSYVANDPSLIRSGISAAGAHKLDLVSGLEADGYLRANLLDGFIRNHALSHAGPEGNARLRLVPEKAWHYLDGLEVAPLAAVALDLAEDPDPRLAHAGQVALRDIDKHRLVRHRAVHVAAAHQRSG